MKNPIIIFLIILFSSVSFTQDYNSIVIDDKSEKPMLIGNCTREAFDDTSFSGWWIEEYNSYEVDIETAELLKDNWDNVEITLVMGTWCSDSRREVPRFYKILDEIKYPSEVVHLINVNREMVGLEDEVDGLDIHFVPTMIFYGRGKELGRIVEMPFESLEKDMLKILQK